MKDVTLKFIVLGSGDMSVGIRPSTEHVTITLHEQDDTTLDVPELTEAFRQVLKDHLENVSTEVLTEAEANAREWEYREDDHE